VAVDDFLAANRALCEQIRTQIGVGLAGSIDQSHLSENLGVFSRYVTLLDEIVDGDHAVVTFMVDDRLPSRKAELVRIDGVWRYDPGPGYHPALPRAFHRMARGLRQVSDELGTGRLSVADVRNDPDLLLDEVRVRLIPGVQMLPAPPATSRPAGG